MKIEIGVAQAQGPRPSMEDAHCLIPDFAGKKGALFAALFDGHGGAEAAQMASKELPRRFEQALGRAMSVQQAFLEAYSSTGELIRQATASGTTAATVYIAENQFHFAHVGDSRIVLLAGGRAEALTRDHKVVDPIERERLAQRGGKFWASYLVLPNGMGLAVSRALGDRDFRDFITDAPDIGARPLTKGDSRLILACDGLWDVVSNDQTRTLVFGHGEAGKAAEALVREAIHRGTGDNVTVVVVHIQED